ncbi:MAG: lipid-A-disaccharide synthase, partial [Cyclobacteriaceae bacterium]|nr:lipid-A-disaccharide synthase [Cyclobacteriaceae bacterium]
PDVVILVDFGGFNMRIAKFCKQNNIKVFYYISPKVWAWNQSRALKLKENVDRLFCILPFEKNFFKKYDWEVDYVGNPVMDAVKSHVVDKNFKVKWELEADRKIIALLPGSRKQELNNMLPVMRKVVKRFPEYQFAVAAIRNFDKSLYGLICKEPNVKLVYEDTYNLLAHSTSAVVTSGTATLETALWKVPQVVPYRSSPITMFIAKLLVKLKYISLVNLIVDREVVKEYIQENMTEDNISTELIAITQGNKRKQILEDYDDLFNILGKESVSNKTAMLMVKYLNE